VGRVRSFSVDFDHSGLILVIESDSIITRVIRSSVEIAIFGAFFCVSYSFVVIGSRS
jgi:hypothetical protein